jgi:hypothetical protein
MRQFAVSLVLLMLVTPAFAQDGGAPDSVLLENVAISAGQATVHVTLINDEPLSGLQLPLHYSTDLLILDSVTFGTRAAGFTGDDIVRATEDLGGTSQTVMLALVPLETGAIAAGSDVIATLWFTQNGLSSADTAVISDTSLTPAGGLLLGDSATVPAGYVPTFVGGVVYVSSAISDRDGTVPRNFELLPNYPNPFNPSTAISFALPEPRHVVLDVYNLLGQRVVRLFDGLAPAGYLDLVWNGRDHTGRSVGSGVYFYRVSAGEFNQVRKMVLLK